MSLCGWYMFVDVEAKYRIPIYRLSSFYFINHFVSASTNPTFGVYIFTCIYVGKSMHTHIHIDLLPENRNIP